MKKINIKATIFLSAIVLVVVVLLLNLIEFRKTVDFTVPGIQMPKENAYGKQEEVQVSVNGTYYYRVLPWIKQRISEGGKRGWLDRNPGCSDHRSDLSGGTECGKRDDIRRESRQLRFISGGNTGRSLCHSGCMVSRNAGKQCKDRVLCELFAGGVPAEDRLQLLLSLIHI